MSTVVTDADAKRHIAANVSRLLAERIPRASQAELARAVGESHMTISYLIRGIKMPGAALLARVAEFFGVSSDSLLSPPPARPSRKKSA